MDRLRPRSACADAVARTFHPPQTLAPSGTPGSRYSTRYGRCGSPALASRQSRRAQEGRKLCHEAARQSGDGGQDRRPSGETSPATLPTGCPTEEPRWAEAVRPQDEDVPGAELLEAGLNQTAESCEEPSVEEDESPNSRRPAPPAARGLSHGFATGRGQRLMQAELAKSSSSPVAKEKEPAKMSHTSPAPAPRTARAPLGLARPPLSPATPCQADEGISANAASLEPGSLNKGSGQRSVPGSELRAADSGSRDASSTGASRPASPSTHVSEESGAASTAQPGDSTGQRTSWPSQARSTPTVPLEKAYAVYIPSLEGSVPFNEREMQAQAAVPVLSERSPRYQSVAAASKQASKEPVPTRSSTPTSPRRTKKVLAQPLSSPAGPKSPRRPSPVTELQAPKAEISASSSCAASVAGEEGIPSGSASARAAGTAWTKRFELVKSRGRSSSPPARDKLESWRAGHIPPDCIIKRRRQKKGPKEKLLILPFLACEDDPRFSHLFETLEAKQPEILSESLANLRGLFSGVRVG